MDKSNFFPLPLKAEYIGAGQWKLIVPFEYHCEKYGIIKVPINFVSDGASIPSFAWGMIGSPWTGKYVEATIPHDFCYSKNLYSRKKCDLIFYEAMQVLKVPFWKRWTMYHSVRTFGWVPWNRYKKIIEKTI